MGYDIFFDGRFTLDRPLAPEHKAELDRLASEEHEGEDGTPTKEARSGRPCPYCQWTPTPDGTAIVWDLGEKFYGWLEWLQCIVENRLKPWGYRLNGEVQWRGEFANDAGIIYVRDNR